MSKIARVVIMIAGLVLASIAGCDTGGDVIADRINRYMNKTKADEVRQLIAKELPVGSSAESVEAFFQRHKIEYSWDRFANRYQAIIRGVSKNSKLLDQAIVIYINVDAEKRFVNAEVQDSFK